MGLTVHYRLRSAMCSVNEARDHVLQIRSRALELPFAQVSQLHEIAGASEIEALDRDHPAYWFVCQARHHFEHDGLRYFVMPLHLIAFDTPPGDGCEPMSIGLCQYPCTLLLNAKNGPQKRIRTGVRSGDWTWSSFCKTQYASDPQCGGISNFLKCHLLVTAILDCAKSLELLESVDDESGYWENRNLEALTNRVSRWDPKIARIAGQLKDKIDKQLATSIKDLPQVEPRSAEDRPTP